MGIHHEITGVRGMMLNRYAKQRPEYIEAADVIAASKAVTTLLRCPGIQNGDNEKYELTKEEYSRPIEMWIVRLLHSAWPI